MNVPNDINLEKLPGPNRSTVSAICLRDEIIWSPNKRLFALAYSIIEATYGNEVGCILWGMFDGKNSKVLGNPKGILASCGVQPWCKWLDEKSFVFEVQKYDGKITHVSLVIIHCDKGFTVLPSSNDKNGWLDGVSKYDGIYQNYDEHSLIKAITNI